LDLEIMIAGPQRPKLVDSPGDGMVTDGGRIGSVDPASLFDSFEIRMPSIPAVNAPLRALSHDAIKVLSVEIHKSMRADSSRHVSEERRHQ
jgi:hypothetical protein